MGKQLLYRQVEGWFDAVSCRVLPSLSEPIAACSPNGGLSSAAPFAPTRTPSPRTRQGSAPRIPQDVVLHTSTRGTSYTTAFCLLATAGTEQQGWQRFSSWLADMIDSPHTRVLAVAHAGILRIALTRLLGAETLRQHPDARYESDLGRLLLPNCSVTILEITIVDNNNNNNQQYRVRQLASTTHLAPQQVETKTANDC